MSTRKPISERIDAQREKVQQMQNRINKLKKKERGEQEKERNRRIYKRGAHFESLLKDTIKLSDARFYTFLERTVANRYGHEVLAKLVAEQAREDAENEENNIEQGA